MENCSQTQPVRTNYIFVDFENVQQAELDRIADKPVKVVLVLGNMNIKLPVKLVKLIHRFSGQVRLIESSMTGKNAADFVLACEVGVESERDSKAYFHILSRDKGFDVLINHLKAKGVYARRYNAFNEIPVVMNLTERVKRLANDFQTPKATRSRKQKGLEAQIQQVFGRALSTQEVAATIRALVAEKIVTLSDQGEVSYNL